MGLKANTELANTENEALMWDCAEKPTGSGSQSASKTGPGLRRQGVWGHTFQAQEGWHQPVLRQKTGECGLGCALLLGSQVSGWGHSVT